MPPEPTEKKGLHPMAWVGIGCGGLLVVAIIAIALGVGFFKRKVSEFQAEMAADPHRTAAEMIVKLNPDLEMVSDDETAGEMTIRVKSSGEEMTVSYADLADGKITVTDDDGTTTQIGKVDLSEVPAWVPRYPKVIETGAVYHQDQGGRSQGMMMFTTADTPEQVVAFYDSAIASASTSSSSVNLGSTTRVTRTYEDAGRKITLTAAGSGGGDPTQVTLNYESPTP